MLKNVDNMINLVMRHLLKEHHKADSVADSVVLVDSMQKTSIYQVSLEIFLEAVCLVVVLAVILIVLEKVKIL